MSSGALETESSRCIRRAASASPWAIARRYQIDAISQSGCMPTTCLSARDAVVQSCRLPPRPDRCRPRRRVRRAFVPPIYRHPQASRAPLKQYRQQSDGKGAAIGATPTNEVTWRRAASLFPAEVISGRGPRSALRSGLLLLETHLKWPPRMRVARRAACWQRPRIRLHDIFIVDGRVAGSVAIAGGLTTPEESGDSSKAAVSPTGTRDAGEVTFSADVTAAGLLGGRKLAPAQRSPSPFQAPGPRRSPH